MENPSEELLSTSLELLDHIDGLPEHVVSSITYIIELSGQVTTVTKPGTKMICHRCHAINAAGYMLRRSGGKYIALCINPDGGCASKDITPQCSFFDHEGVQCDKLAEYEILDGFVSIPACVIHIGILLKDSSCTVTPI